MGNKYGMFLMKMKYAAKVRLKTCNFIQSQPTCTESDSVYALYSLPKKCLKTHKITQLVIT
ncbi:hypothetical protein B0A68_14250 [Flavobacterium reichenbachii]|nr:hypothetical protein B0A68_14250 [Flavobacterium reichenbachii]